MSQNAPSDPRTQHLRKLLASFEPGDASEVGFRQRMEALVGVGSPALDRAHYDPGHFTASAFVLDPPRERVLLVHHRKLGRWLQPGGHVEAADPNVRDAARREATEETGIGELDLAMPGLFDVDIHEIPGFGASPPHLHFDVRFLFVARTPDLRPSQEVKDARWVPLSELDAMTDDESVLRAGRKLR